MMPFYDVQKYGASARSPRWVLLFPSTLFQIYSQTTKASWYVLGAYSVVRNNGSAHINVQVGN